MAGSELGSGEHGMPVAPTAFSASPRYKTVGVELVFQSSFLLGPSLLLVGGTGARNVNAYLNVARLQLISELIRRCFERRSAITKGRQNCQPNFFLWLGIYKF